MNYGARMMSKDYTEWLEDHMEFCSQSDEWLFKYLMSEYYIKNKATSYFVRFIRENKTELYARWERILLLR